MKTTTKIVAGTIAALSLATASAVFAHQGMGMGPGAGQGMAMGSGMGPGMRGGMHGPESVAVTAARLSDLKAELKITPAQDSAWQAYAAVVQQQAATRESMRTQMQAQMQAKMQAPRQEQSASAPVDRSARHEAMSQQREQHFTARSAAVKDLYAVLTPEQKTLAEQRLSVMPGHRMAWGAPAK